MPFIRHARDRRGYESTYVMHVYRPTQQGPNRTRVLYLFRSPSSVRVGRQALDPEAMEALEHTHPDLSFDWTAIRRDPAAVAVDLQPRASRPQHRPAVRPAAVPPEPAIVIDDESVLGRSLGGVEAARWRQRYNELVQRIARRSRTPEERDRLTERARRLNPDDWPDDVAVRAGMETLEADWDGVVTELPSRRRGRRGGRRRGQLEPDRRSGPPGAETTAPEPALTEPSVIMSGGEQDNASPENARMDRPDRDSGAPGDDSGGRGPDAPADSADADFSGDH